MSDTSLRPARAPLAAAILGLLALVGFDAAAAAPSSASTNLAAAAPAPPALTPAPAPSAALGTPRGSGETKPRMWAVSLSNMVVYENGSGYLYGFWRQFGEAVEKPARLYWGRGCPDISDRVYHVLQAGFAQQQQFFLIVDRDPDPRQPGAFCVRGVELESRFGAPPPAPASPPPPAPKTAPAPGSK
ncbi:hypothetical protein SAMN02745121_00665 [Nannocystis exedens]|uniref:Uncharacterized protein n=1 Tax=Nannocystis exedens TaxID=54 RepID=A0A1I1TEY1_9BACT|nr:hypothetical protein [Nannocystis exedens]PCC66605.1 hypothetical protein NAEX_09194 [Nannocystis exedens]SFD57149.1 hypothetical protein SAMN02745121_00665 [Nannocystis exedens]